MSTKDFFKMTVNSELLNDLPNLEVITNGNLNYYKTVDITNGELTVINISDEDDEFYLTVKNLSNKNSFLVRFIILSLILHSIISKLSSIFLNFKVFIIQ